MATASFSSQPWPLADGSRDRDLPSTPSGSLRMHFRRPRSPFLNLRSSPGETSSSTPSPPFQPQPLPGRSTTPRLSRLLGTVLGSPFLVSQDIDFVDGALAAVPRSAAVTRPSSPAPTLDYSIISPPTPPLSPADDLYGYNTSVLSNGHSPSYFASAIPEISLSLRGGESTPMFSLFPSPSKRTAVFPYEHEPSYSPYATVRNRSPMKRIWDAISSPTRKTVKGKQRTMYLDDGEPLDGEEGELIDDEACFVREALRVTGVDIIGNLPPEISLYLLLYLDLPSVLTCLAVSHRWRLLASDNLVWRELFRDQTGWSVNPRVASKRLALARRASSTTSSHLGRTGGMLSSPLSQQRDSQSSRLIRRLSVALPSGASLSQRLSVISSVDSFVSYQSHRTKSTSARSLALDWQALYKTRAELDRKWIKSEPKITKIAGHEDSVYCLEFDTDKIITGSRDRTIKVWALRTGKLMRTLRGHSGSVLCLKFDRTGFMVSGSSDCSILVWDLNAKATDGEKKAELRGHHGGVLDLRIDNEWIVSCSKDAMIRVWQRSTLQPFCTFSGHEGPVNAVGLQNGKVVSASGDGRMMLWDIQGGQRIRTFEGHDRGLACIDFKDDYIVSGSNDSKIKVWRASTGECLRTLTGHDLLVRALAFDPSAGRLVSASYDRSIKVWDLHTGKMVRDFRNAHGSHIFDVRFDACRIVSTSHDQKIAVLDFGGELDTEIFL